LIETETYSLQKLTGYFSANTLIDSDKCLDFSVNDRFQTPSHCDLVQLREPVQFDPNAMELWPSVAEYFVYDELLYYALTHDERRNQSYKIAMNQLVKNKIVVEVGTGKEAILSRFCVEAGAKKVYAIEIGDDAYQEAVACVNNLGLSDKIILIHGDSTQVEIPELADVCVSEIVGPIGGCEGAALLMNDARRFLKPSGVMLPAKSVTKMVAISFPNELWTDLGFNPVPGSYTEKIFAQIGYPFDLRVCIKKFPQSNILSNADIFEDLDFNHPIELEHSHTINLTISQEAQLNGFLVWLNLHTVEGEVIDILEYEYSWLPVYLPIFHPGIQVSAGDTIQATCERRLCENGLNPDYHLKGCVLKQNGEVIEFEHHSYHHKQVFKQSAFFQKLFAQNEFGYNQKTRLDKLTQHLPEMPLTENGTIDREKLLALRDPRKAATQVVPQNELERQIAEIWQEVLGVPTVGIHDNFFELGGHSLLLVQAQNQLQALFGSQLSLVDMFNAPTIDALAKHLSSDTEPKSSQQGQARAQIRTHHQAAVDNSDIAIVGMSCRFPGANTLDEFWQNLRDGVESITFFSDDDVAASGIDPTSANAPHYVKASPLLDNVEWFDAGFFGYTAKEAELLDPQQRLFLECAWEAMEIAGYDPQSYSGSIGLYAGASMNTYLLNQVYPNRSRLDSNDNLEVATLDSLGGFQLMVANDKDYLPTRTSYKLNLKGPSINVQTACSTTLVTVHLACQSLLNGECDMVLSGGSSVQIPQKAGHLFQEGMIVSPDGHCRAFDARAQGTVFGSGVGVVVLKRLTDAIADGDHIYAVIKGSAVNNDGLMKVGYMAPSSEGQAAVASEALAMSGVAAETIQYVEAHGTGTEMGDPIEVSGLTQAFRASTDKKEFCAIGSVKTNVGHLQIASGVVGLMKTVLALYHKQIPPSLHFENPNPQIDFANSPFYVNTQLRDFQTNGTPCRAGVNSLGIGGTNAHVILEEAPKQTSEVLKTSEVLTRPQHLLTLSAKSEAALHELVQRYEPFLLNNPKTSLADICFTANTGRVHFDHRIAVVADSTQQLRQNLSDISVPTRQTNDNRLNIAFLFTGQGAQYVGMGRQLYETQPTFRQTLVSCDEILRDYLEQPLLEIIYSSLDDQSQLNETAYTQPALFALEYALAELWQSWGIKPTYVMGHSVGEYVAACIAGVFSLEDGLKLIAERARLMQALPRDGEMVTVFASEARVATAIEPYLQQVSTAAINGPESIVISGQHEAIATIKATLESQGIKTKPLSVSHAFHSPLIEPMLPAFSHLVGEVTLSSPQINLISNLTGELATAEITTSAYWCRHVTHPVKFAASMATLYEQGCDVFVEIGPKPALLGMGRQCLPEDVGIWLPCLRQGQDDWQQLLQSLGELYVRGATIDWAGFDRDYQRRRVALPTYPFQRQRYWLDREKRITTQSENKLHPLLDKKTQSPLLKETLFETYFHKDSINFLADHLVYDKVVASGASYISMVLGAAQLTFGSQGCVLEEILFEQALVIPEEGCTVQLVITPEKNNKAAFKLISFAKNTENWITHVTGKIQTGQIDSPLKSENFQALWDRCPQTITANEFYQTQLDRHIYLGPSYQWIESIRRGNGEAVCQITIPPAVADADKYQLHPGLIDAGFGLLASAVDMEIEESFVPFSIEKIRFYQHPSYFPLWAHLQKRPESGKDQLLGDIRLFDHLGQMIIEFKGLEGRKATRAGFMAGMQEESWQDWLYEVEWQPQMRIGLLPDYIPLSTEISSRLKSYIAGAQIEFYETFKPQIEAVSVTYLLNAIGQMGWRWKLNEHFSTTTFASQLGVVSQHQKLLRRLLEILHEEQIIQPRGDEQWEVISIPKIEDSSVHMNALLAQYPAVNAELTLLARCGAKLHEVLRGEYDPLQLLFPDGDLTTLTQFYQDSPGPQLMNTILQKVVLSALARLPQGRGVRVLEIGAGTGGTTAYLLPHLPVHQTEYVFTDVSPLFTTKAQEKFVDYSFMRYQVLDIEQAPIPQGFGEHEYDIIIAANVLHATKDLDETLQHVHSLLAPGGMLVLMEGTARQRWLDLTFGLIEGWWRFADQDLRPDYALLSVAQWQTLLKEKEFTQIATLSPDQENEAFALQQAVIVAQKPRSNHEINQLQKRVSGHEQWLIFAESQGLGQQLAELIEANGENYTLVFSGKAYKQIGEQSFKIDPTRPEDFQQLVKAVIATQHRLRGIVYCWSLEAVEADALTVADLEIANQQGCGATLHLIQALVKAELSEPPSLWLVTQGAIPVRIQAQNSKIENPSLAQSSLWGMGKVIALEYPELNCVRVDLDPQTKGTEAQTLFEEIWSKSQEDQVALRDNARYVARLVRSEIKPLKIDCDNSYFHDDSTYLITGGLGDLGLLVASFLVEKHGVKYLALVGRRPVRSEVNSQLMALEEAGAKVVILQADVSKIEQVAKVLADIEQSLPPLRGIIHAAGVLDDGVLSSQNWQRFENVLAPKVQGAWNLHTLTKEFPLDFFVLFSSASSLLGYQAQANHAAANTFLDALAYYRQAQGLAGLSINWGAWSEIGAAAKRKAGERMEMQGIGTIAPHQGLQILEQLFSQSATQIGVVPINWSQFLLTQWGSLPFFNHFKQVKAQTVSKQEINFVEQLKAMPAKEQRTHLITHVQSQVANVLGSNASPIEAQQGFFDFGFDSLTSIELRNRLQKSLGCSLPSTVLFSHPTVEELVEYLASDVLGLGENVQNDDNLNQPRQSNDEEFDYLKDLNHDELEALINQDLESN
jgi:acyl transferase domain-containing protein/acyl carrier protein/predicted O-methyltransferase YrrM